MPRIHDARHDSFVLTVARALVFIVACTVAVVMLREAGHMVGDPTSAFARYRSPPKVPHVFVKGTVQHQRKADVYLPPLCLVEHESYVSCGKSYCWRSKERFRYSGAAVEIADSTGPLPTSMNLDPQFQYEPWTPPRTVIDSQARSRQWKTYAEEHGISFPTGAFSSSSSDRIVETCLTSGDPVFVEACVSPSTPGLLEPCSGQERYGLVSNGDGQAAIDDAADDVARYLGGAAAALLVAALAWLKVRRPIMAGLEDRAAPHRRTLGWIWALLGVPPVLVFATVFMHASHPPSTWSTGRGGFAFALSMLAAWLFFALQRWVHRRRTLSALEPVLATPRSLLAQANGTVELAVKAKGNDLRSFIGNEPVAYSEMVITESYRQGKNTSTHEVYRGRLRDQLKVVDESGDGVLDLSSSVLDVELRTITMNTLSPRYYEHGISVVPHPQHVSFTIKEWLIKDDEPLYVFGDVSDIALHASEGGYRTVRGSPTLGGKDAAPVLVHSGDERGLIALLSSEARGANSYAVVAACMCAGIAAAVIALARF